MHEQFLLHSPQTGATPLYIACENNHADIVGVLLAAGANADLAIEVRQCTDGDSIFDHLCTLVWNDLWGCLWYCRTMYLPLYRVLFPSPPTCSWIQSSTATGTWEWDHSTVCTRSSNWSMKIYQTTSHGHRARQQLCVAIVEDLYSIKLHCHSNIRNISTPVSCHSCMYKVMWRLGHGDSVQNKLCTKQTPILYNCGMIWS